MDRSYMLNDYIRENDENKEQVGLANSYLDGLRMRINGSKSLTEIMIEVSKFLDQNDVPENVKKDIIDICNSFDESTTVYDAQTKLENSVSNYLDSRQGEYAKSNDTVEEIKRDVIDDATRKLDEVGIELTGDEQEAIENINDVSDVYRIQDNVDNAYNYFEERNQILGEEAPNVEVSLNTIDEVVNSPEDNIVLEEALDNQDKMIESTNPSLLHFNEDGSATVNCDIKNDDSLNFTAMMTTALVASSENLDMKVIKNKEDISTFKVIYGNFPLVNHPENKLDSAVVAKIQDVANNYNGYTNYMEILGNKSPELKLALDIVYNNVFGQVGAFQLAVNSTDQKQDILFAMDDNYQNIVEAFRSNGAMVTMDEEEHSIASVVDTMPGDKLVILNSTNEQLVSEKKVVTDPSLVAGYQYVKKIDVNQAANVNYFLLTTVAAIEIILVLAYFMVFFLF